MDTPPTTNATELEQRRLCVIALGLAPGANLGRVLRLSEMFPPERLIHETRTILDDTSVLPSDVAWLSKVAAADPQQLLDEAARQVQLSEKYRARIITCLERDYPINLREAPTAPALLFIRGRLIPDEDRCSIAIVGSRDSSESGRKRATRLAQVVTSFNWVVVSGLARGIDTAAHEGALNAGGRTLAVVGCGLGRTYPPENADLADRIAEHGAIISQFPFGTPPAGHNFPQRNKTMAVLSLATVVIEAGEKSGAKMQADYALSTHIPQRRVFFPRSLMDSHGEGGWTQQYVRRGAEVIEKIEDLVPRLKLSVAQQAMLPMWRATIVGWWWVVGVKVVMLDLDGTLIGPGDSAVQDTVEMTQALKAAGLTIVVTTGRRGSWQTSQLLNRHGYAFDLVEDKAFANGQVKGRPDWVQEICKYFKVQT